VLAGPQGGGAEGQGGGDLSAPARAGLQEPDHRDHADRAGQVQADPQAHDATADSELDHPGFSSGRQGPQSGTRRQHRLQGQLGVQVWRTGFHAGRVRFWYWPVLQN